MHALGNTPSLRYMTAFSASSISLGVNSGTTVVSRGIGVYTSLRLQVNYIRTCSPWFTIVIRCESSRPLKARVNLPNLLRCGYDPWTSHSDAAVLWDVYDFRHSPLNVLQHEMKVAPSGITLLYRSFRGCHQAQSRIVEGGGVDIKAYKTAEDT